MEIEKLIRKNIWELQPYSCAREEYEGGQAILLDANEKSFRYGSESLSGSLSAGIEERIGPTEGSEGGSYDFGKWER
jgi:histidinol-phosphate aminotransferase